MKVVILAGGLGTRLSEETQDKPKPMVEIGGIPMLIHIMNIYWAYGYTEFVIAAGYKSEIIKSFFSNYNLHCNDISINLDTGKKEIIGNNSPPWNVRVIDTGKDTMTGGRLKKLYEYGHIGDERFMVTYGDGLADININSLIDFHLKSNSVATVTAVHPPSRFGLLHLKSDFVKKFEEKPQMEEGWINGGFFVFEKEIFHYIQDDSTRLEGEPLEKLANDGKLKAFRHEGFWQPMDTLREKNVLEKIWQSNEAPWYRKRKG